MYRYKQEIVLAQTGNFTCIYKKIVLVQARDCGNTPEMVLAQAGDSFGI